jgi:hypothetical protein
MVVSVYDLQCKHVFSQLLLNQLLKPTEEELGMPFSRRVRKMESLDHQIA